MSKNERHYHGCVILIVAALSLWRFELFLRMSESHPAVLHEQLGKELRYKNESEAEECNHFLAGLSP